MKRLTLLLSLAIALVAIESTAQQVNSDLYRNTPRGGAVSSGMLPDLVAYDERGEGVNLQQLCKGKYTLLITGCITCPEFRKVHPELEAINRDYAPKGVQSFFIFKSLRHPELDGYVEPQKISERLLLVDHIKELLGGEITWLVDGIDNKISSTLRSGSRTAYLISPQGEIIQSWSKPEQESIRQALNQEVGAPKRMTSAMEMNLPVAGRVQRRDNMEGENTIERCDGLVIVKSTPKNPEDTYYVKMRAEADASLLASGSGRLALGFFPDPIYDAHWNNLAEPMQYIITAPQGAKVSPQKASAKRGKGDSDSDPRQFWVDIKGASPNDQIEITYHYYGCSPDMCEAFTHSYTIEITPEANGASTFGFNKGERGNHANSRQSHSSPSSTRQRSHEGYSSQRNYRESSGSRHNY